MKRNIIPRICSLRLENDIAYGHKTNIPLSKGYMPTFSLNKRAKERNGQFYLPAPITINGTTVWPSARYRGKDATITSWPAWQYGSNLTIFGSGADPTPNNGSPLLGLNDDSLLFNQGKSYQGPDNDYLNTGTKDFIIEGLIDVKNYLTSEWIISNFLTLLGYALYISSGIFNLVIGNGTAQVLSSYPLSGDGSFYFSCIVDRSGSQRLYINNFVASTSDITSVTGSLSQSSNKFTIGADVTGSIQAKSAIEYLAIYMQQDWLDTHEQDSLIEERFSNLIGIYPQIARGTAIPTVQVMVSLFFTKDAACPNAPEIVAADASDSDFVWTKPDQSTFTGKTPDVSNFSTSGTYKLMTYKGNAITELDFSDSNLTSFSYIFLNFLMVLKLNSNSGLNNDVSGWSLPSSLVTLYLYNTSVSGDISGWSLPSSLVNLNLFNTSVSGDISGWSLPSSLVNLNLNYSSSIEYGTSKAFENVTNNDVIRVKSCSLITAEIDRILEDLVTSTATGGTLDVSLNDPPTGGTSNADYLTLISRGWSITL